VNVKYVVWQLPINIEPDPLPESNWFKIAKPYSTRHSRFHSYYTCPLYYIKNRTTDFGSDAPGKFVWQLPDNIKICGTGGHIRITL
jgi:hypothetical protein